jgi:hypothetical protein
MKTKSKTKEYSHDSEDHIKYWYNRTTRWWEVYDYLRGDWVGFNFKHKIDAQNAAHYHYENGIYAYANGVFGNPLTRKDVSTWAMTTKNEKKFTKITRIDGKEFTWVGIGWV